MAGHNVRLADSQRQNDDQLNLS
jgi:spartin